MRPYEHLEFTDTFLTTLVSKQFSPREQLLFLKAVKLLDEDERHPSLGIHELQGKDKGIWSVSASEELRITFERKPSGLKTLGACSRHYRG